MAYTVTIPYEDYNTLLKASCEKDNVVKLLNASFEDESNQLIAIKSVLNIEEKKDEDAPADSTSDNTSGTTTPTDTSNSTPDANGNTSGTPTENNTNGTI